MLCEDKISHLPFPEASEITSKEVGDLIYTNLADPFKVTTPSRLRFSRELGDEQQYANLIKNQLEWKQKIIRAVGGG